MRGGRRPGAGRPKGATNKRTEALAEAVAATAAELEATIPNAFTGDAHGLLMAIYKDPEKELGLRLDAAKAAIRYEKPALASVDARHSVDIDVHAWLVSAEKAAPRRE